MQNALCMARRPLCVPLTKTILRVMQLTAIFLLAACLHVTASSRAQTVTYSGTNVPLTQVFAAVEQQTGYFVSCTAEELRNTKPITVSAKDVSLDEFLHAALIDQPLQFVIKGNTIFIRKKPAGVNTSKPEFNMQTPPIKISGTIVGPNNQPLVGATIRVKGKAAATASDENGYFELEAEAGNTLVISYIGFKEKEFKARAGEPVRIEMIQADNGMDTAEIVLNSGYQQIPKDRAAGAYTFLNKEQLDKRVATNIISKLEGITSGLVFNKSPDGKNQIRVRGENTLFGNADPLIVVDNFPYDGDINSINPNDVENITVLKDAAATSIWGVRAGNGVIVITTRRGKVNQLLKVEVNTNWTLSDKPDLFYKPEIQSSDFIDLEKMLFEKDYYKSLLNNPNLPAISPVLEILNKQKEGLISETEANNQIDRYRTVNYRNDFLKYVYQRAISQQYQINLSGGSGKNSYYFSAGFDKNRGSSIRNTDQRITLSGQNLYKPTKNLDFWIGFNYAEGTTKNNGISNIPNLFPYNSLMDQSGNELSITQHRAGFEDTISQRNFLDWKYYPLQERSLNNNSVKLNDLRILPGIRLLLPLGIGVEATYQYQRANSNSRNLNDENSYYIRNLLNSFAILDDNKNYTGSNYYKGGQLALSNATTISHTGRVKANINHNWQNHSISAIVGFEAREIKIQQNGNTFYGYDVNSGAFVIPNTTTNFRKYPTGFGQLVSPGERLGLRYRESINRFRSYFSTASYTYLDRYTISASARLDGSNYFGVETNKKTVPLWSSGIKWDISKEKFWKPADFTIQSLRVTYGYSGNLDKSIAAVTTIAINENDAYTGLPYAIITNLPNPNLRWEKIGQLNIGVDFDIFSKRIYGSIDYYQKRGKDLIGESPMDPTSGVTEMRGNFSGMKSHGIDLVINSINLRNSNFKWRSTLLLNYSSEKVTKYDIPVPTSNMVSAYTGVTPIVGKPLYSIYSLKWAGLDPATGDPRVILGDTLSKVSNFSPAELKQSDFSFFGRYNPLISGSLINEVSWRSFTAAICITYKFKYYFRRSSINYSNTLTGGWKQGHQDFAYRWQQPGDEKNTNVPSFVYPDLSGGRDFLYNSSDILIEKGDHVRLQFVNLQYDLKRIKVPGIEGMRIGLYVNNIGILWKANNKGIDPDYPYANYPSIRSYALTLKVGL